VICINKKKAVQNESFDETKVIASYSKINKFCVV